MASRYWVGGTATWDGSVGSKWSATNGGAGGSSVPTTADDVFFTSKNEPTRANSTSYSLTNIVTPVTGNGYYYECTTAGTTAASEPVWPTTVGNTVTDGTVVWTCRLATVNIGTGNTGAKSLDYTGFIGNSGNTVAFTVAGSITLSSAMAFNPSTNAISITGTGTLTTAGKAFSALTINGAGITVTLGDALNLSSRTLTVTQGTFTTSASSYSISAGSLVISGTNAKVITLNGSDVTLSGTLDFTNATTAGLTFNPNTSTINLTGANVAAVFGGLTYNNVNFTSTSIGTRTIDSACTFANLTLTASATGMSQLALAANQTITGTLTCAGSSFSQRGFVRSNTIGTARTLTVGTLSANDCDFRDITISGGAVNTAPTRAGNCGGNTGITFPVAKTVYRVGTNTTWAGSASWATGTGGTGSDTNFPLAQDTAIINDDTALSTTLALDAAYNLSAIDCSARTAALTINHNIASSIYGNYTLSSSVSVSGSSGMNFEKRGGTTDFTSAGNTITFPIDTDTISGTFRFLDALNSTAAVTNTSGTLNANNFNITCTAFGSNSTSTRTVTMGSGTWTLTGTGTIWDLTSTGLTLNKNTANIVLSNTGTGARTFSSAGKSYNKLTIGGATGTSNLTIQGAGTFTELASTKTVAHTLIISGNITVGTWSITGSAGNVVTIRTGNAYTQQTITRTGGGYLSGIDYLNIANIVALPASDTWYVGSNSVVSTTTSTYNYGFFTTQRTDNVVYVLTSTTATNWTVPSDWNNSNNSIHLIGGGGGGAGSRVSGSNRAGGAGGGGGGYTRLNNQTLTPGASIPYQCGAGGSGGVGNQNGVAGGTTSWNSGAATAGGGGGGQGTSTSSTAGAAGVGSTYNGGAGGTGAVTTASNVTNGGGGGGGAGGPNGPGGTGGNGNSNATLTNVAGGGGGGNGGGTNGGNASTGTAGTGGNNSNGVGGATTDNTTGKVGGGASGSNNGSGSTVVDGGSGTEIFGANGSGGGGGGRGYSSIQISSSVGGYFGGGGGGGFAGGSTTYYGDYGAQGAIIITYVPPGATPSNSNNMFFIFH